MINKFLEGKKKYTAFLLPLLIAAVQAFQLDSAVQQQLMDYLPTIAAVISGVAYMVIEGTLDHARASAAAQSAQTAVATSYVNSMSLAQDSSAAAVGQTQSQAQATAAPAQPMNTSAPVASFDAEAFDSLVEAKAKETYLEANDMTRYFAAQALGDATKFQSQYQQMQYRDYMEDKALKAFQAKFGFPYAEADKHLADDKSCPYYSVDNMARQKGIDFWYMLRMVRNTLSIAQTGQPYY